MIMIVRKIFTRPRIEVKRELFRRLFAIPDGHGLVKIDGFYLLGVLPLYVKRIYL